MTGGSAGGDRRFPRRWRGARQEGGNDPSQPPLAVVPGLGRQGGRSTSVLRGDVICRGLVGEGASTFGGPSCPDAKSGGRGTPRRQGFPSHPLGDPPSRRSNLLSSAPPTGSAAPAPRATSAYQATPRRRQCHVFATLYAHFLVRPRWLMLDYRTGLQAATLVRRPRAGGCMAREPSEGSPAGPGTVVLQQSGRWPPQPAQTSDPTPECHGWWRQGHASRSRALGRSKTAMHERPESGVSHRISDCEHTHLPTGSIAAARLLLSPRMVFRGPGRAPAGRTGGKAR